MIHRRFFMVLTLTLFSTAWGYGQSLIDISVGSSNSDYVFTTLAWRKQVNDRLRFGIEAQIGAVRYRFIAAKAIRSGYASMVSVPLLYRLYQTDHIRLDFYSRIGFRFQSANNTREDGRQVEASRSTAVNVEPGLMVSIPLSQELAIHSGITLPNLFEITPDFIFENNVSAITGGISYRINERKIFFVKSLTGPAAGADGDSQKFLWSAQLGFRLILGAKSKGNPLVLESSF